MADNKPSYVYDLFFYNAQDVDDLGLPSFAFTGRLTLNLSSKSGADDKPVGQCMLSINYPDDDEHVTVEGHWRYTADSSANASYTVTLDKRVLDEDIQFAELVGVSSGSLFEERHDAFSGIAKIQGNKKSGDIAAKPYLFTGKAHVPNT